MQLHTLRTFFTNLGPAMAKLGLADAPKGGNRKPTKKCHGMREGELRAAARVSTTKHGHQTLSRHTPNRLPRPSITSVRRAAGAVVRGLRGREGGGGAKEGKEEKRS